MSASITARAGATRHHAGGVQAASAASVLGLLLAGILTASAGDAPRPVPVPVPAKAEAPAPAPLPAKIQAIRAKAAIAVQGVVPAIPVAGNVQKADGDDAKDLTRGAELNRDFEADRLLRRVRELLETPQPQYRDVVVLLQNLIDRPGDAFASEDGSVFRPVRYVAERLLAGLGAAGLDAYRMEADAQAKAILGAVVASNRDEEALRTVVRQYFLSSYGDDAAYLLSCLHLDQHDYAKARRLLRRVLTEHPDPSVPKPDMLLRLALACHRCGDADGARAAWKQLAAEGPTRLSAETLKVVETEVTKDARQAAQGQDTVRPTPRGLYPALPSGAVETPRGLCIPAWEHALSVLPPDLPPNMFGQMNEAALGALKDQMVGRWESSGQVPSSHALLRDGAVLVKSQGILKCLDAASGSVRWQTKPPAQPSGRTQQLHIQHFPHLGQSHPIQVLHFDDQIGRAVRVIGNRVCHIEEFYHNRWGQSRFGGAVFLARAGREQPKQVTGNVLAAYDLKSGATLWRMGRTLDDNDPLGAVQFLAAPVAGAGRLVVPFEKRGELWLAGLDPANGKCAWQTFLCSFVVPRTSIDSWRLVGLAAEGSDVYVASGQGFVFALDGTDGSLHWASQYEQEWDRTTPSPFGQGAAPKGWHDGSVFVEGGRLIVLPSDAERVLVLDATSGKPIASHKTPGLDFCLGMDGTHLFAASSAGVRRLDALTGRTLWERKLEGADRACGRGAWTPSTLYVPSGKCILLLDPKNGHVQSTLRVATQDEEPVGNLACDGERLMVIALTSLYAVTNAAPKLAAAERRVADLDKQVASLPQDSAAERRAELLKARAQAHLDRARLRLRYERVAEAAEDLKAAFRDAADDKAKCEARHELVECLTLLAERQPQQRIELLRVAHAIAKATPDEGQTLLPLVEGHRERGELERAVDLLLQFARAGQGTTLDLRLDGDTWRASPVAVASGGIQRLVSQEGAKLAPILAQRGEAAMAPLRTSNDTAALRAVVRLYPGSPAAIEAGLEAAAAEAATGIFEKAEAILREMARSAHRPTAAAGLAALAGLHQKKGWLSQAQWEWTALARDFADTPAAFDGKVRSGSALAAGRLADKELAGADPDLFKGVSEPPWRLVWKTEQQPGTGYPVRVRQFPASGVLGFSQFLEQHLLFQRHGPNIGLICRRMSDGQTLYDVPLGQPPNHVYLQGHEGARDGHIVLLRGNNVLKGFGIVSGKTVWERAEPAGRANVGIHYSVSWRMGLYTRAGGGVPTGCVVQRPDQSTVRVLELATGEVRWERSFRRRQVPWAQEAGAYILLSLDGNECWVCDAFSGDRLSTFQMADASRFGYPRSIQVTQHGALCQTWDPTKSKNTVSLLELPSGKTRWSVDAGQMYRQPIALNEELFYLAGPTGLEVRSVATGEAKFTLPQEKLPGYVNSVTLSADGKTLGFCAHDGQGKMRLGRVELATGRVVSGEGTAFQMFGGMDVTEAWARSGDLIPWMNVEVIKEGNNIRHTNLRIIGFTRKSTGKVLEGHSLPSARADGKFENINQIFVQDGMLVVMRHDGVHVFGHDPNAPVKAPEPPKEGEKQQ